MNKYSRLLSSTLVVHAFQYIRTYAPHWIAFHEIKFPSSATQRYTHTRMHCCINIFMDFLHICRMHAWINECIYCIGYGRTMTFHVRLCVIKYKMQENNNNHHHYKQKQLSQCIFVCCAVCVCNQFLRSLLFIFYCVTYYMHQFSLSHSLSLYVINVVDQLPCYFSTFLDCDSFLLLLLFFL